MPQGRRKIPFSGKAKKAQIQMKREKKEMDDPRGSGDQERQSRSTSGQEVVQEGRTADLAPVLMDVKLTGRGGSNRYDLMFRQETKQELAESREKARRPFKKISDKKAMEMDLDVVYPQSTNYPHRPPWNDMMSKSELEASEAKYFRNYVSELMNENEKNSLSYFELNLETWRQLWRVIEMADILLVIVDVRCPSFPPSLYNYINKSSEKRLILVINKVDLIPADLALAWKDYFEKKFPNLSVVFFSSCPSYNLSSGLTTTKSGLKFRRLRGRISMVAEGARSIFDECQQLAKSLDHLKSIELDSWLKKIENASGCSRTESDDFSSPQGGDGETKVLTIGTIGQPNVGKSSLINSLMGKKVVSVSKTPGHTKHFQTIFLSKSVKLCDCPGLVFPSVMPKPLQILQGSYPIAQVREPLSIVQFLAERVDLPNILSVVHPEKGTTWTAFDICEAWAIKRGYSTARTNRPDVYRAANHILRMTLEGKITLSFVPPNYDPKAWEDHPHLVQIRELLGLSDGQAEAARSDDDNLSEEEEEEKLGEKGDVPNSDSDEESDPEPVKVQTSKFHVLMEED